MDSILLENISRVGINLNENQIKNLLQIEDIKNIEDQIQIYKDVISTFFYLEENRNHVMIPSDNFEFVETSEGWTIETDRNLLESLVTNDFISKKEKENLDTVFLFEYLQKGNTVIGPLITLSKKNSRISDIYFPIYLVNNKVIKGIISGKMKSKNIYFGGKIINIQINQKQTLKRSSSSNLSELRDSPSVFLGKGSVPTMEQWSSMTMQKNDGSTNTADNNQDQNKKFKPITQISEDQKKVEESSIKKTSSESELSEINKPIGLQRSNSSFSNFFERSFTPVSPVPASSRSTGSKFNVIKLLGKGSFNIVYLIEDQLSKKEYIYRKSINKKDSLNMQRAYKQIKEIDNEINYVNNSTTEIGYEDNIDLIMKKYKLDESINLEDLIFKLNEYRNKLENQFYLIDYKLNTHDPIIDNLNQTLLFSYIESLNLKLLIPEIIYVCKEKSFLHNSPHICSIMEKMDGTLKDIFLTQFNVRKSIKRLKEILKTSKEIEELKEEDLSILQKSQIGKIRDYYGNNYELKILNNIASLESKIINDSEMLEIWLEFLFQICCGLFFLQDKLEFNHNDMKTDNIFFKYNDPSIEKITKDNFRVFIGDFGFSRFKIGDLVSQPSLIKRQQYDKNFDIYLFLLCHVISWDGTTEFLPDGLYTNIKNEASSIIDFCKINQTDDINLSPCLQIDDGLKGGSEIENVLQLYNFGAIEGIYTNPINVLKYLKDKYNFDVERCKSLFCKNE